VKLPVASEKSPDAKQSVIPFVPPFRLDIYPPRAVQSAGIEGHLVQVVADDL
jgi:hypothetical protein